MKQTIEIDVPDGKVAVWEDGKVFFYDAKPLLPKTWGEYVKYYRSDEPSCLRIASIMDIPNYIVQQHIALIQLHQLRDCYRQGWEPDYSNHNSEFIWSIFKRRGVLMVRNFVSDSHFLSFPSEGLAEEFLNNFRDLIEQAGDLI